MMYIDLDSLLQILQQFDADSQTPPKPAIIVRMYLADKQVQPQDRANAKEIILGILFASARLGRDAVWQICEHLQEVAHEINCVTVEQPIVVDELDTHVRPIFKSCAISRVAVATLIFAVHSKHAKIVAGEPYVQLYDARLETKSNLYLLHKMLRDAAAVWREIEWTCAHETRSRPPSPAITV